MIRWEQKIRGLGDSLVTGMIAGEGCITFALPMKVLDVEGLVKRGLKTQKGLS